MSKYINCLKPAETLQIATDACNDQVTGPGWLMRKFYNGVPSFDRYGRFRFVQYGDTSGQAARYVCSPCEPGTSAYHGDTTFITEMQIPHLKLQDGINWCSELPSKYRLEEMPFEELEHDEVWRIWDTEMTEQQLVAHFTALNEQAAQALKWGEQKIRWANPDEEAAAADESAEYKLLVHGRNKSHYQDFTSGKADFDAWGKGRTMSDIHADIAQQAELVGDAVNSAVTDVVMGPHTFAQGIQKSTDFRKYFGNTENCCREIPEGNLESSLIKSYDCDRLAYHGNLDGIDFWTLRDTYRDADGKMQYMIDPGHALFVANGSNGYQGQFLRGGIHHPQGGSAQDGRLIIQGGESADGMSKEQTFMSRDFVYPGRTNATAYFKVINPASGGSRGKVEKAA